MVLILTWEEECLQVVRRTGISLEISEEHSPQSTCSMLTTLLIISSEGWQDWLKYWLCRLLGSIWSWRWYSEFRLLIVVTCFEEETQSQICKLMIRQVELVDLVAESLDVVEGDHDVSDPGHGDGVLVQTWLQICCNWGQHAAQPVNHEYYEKYLKK